MPNLGLCVFLIFSLPFTAAWSGFPDQLEPVREVKLPAEIGGAFVVYPSLEHPETIIIPLEDGTIHKVTGQGDSVWSKKIGRTITAPLAVGDLDGDGTPEILAIAGATEVCALSGTGDVLWRYPLEGEIGAWKGPATCDLDGDQAAEVLISDDAGWLTCLKGKGSLAWRLRPDRFRGGQCSVGDVDRDGHPEIFLGTEGGCILCLNEDGSVRWLHKGPGKYGRSYLALADLDGDGSHEAIWSTSYNAADSRVYVCHAVDGTPYWDNRTILHGYGSCSVGDLDGKEGLEVIFGDRANTIYAYRGDGAELWRTTTGGRGFMFPQNIADIDGDGKVEILAVCRDANEEGKSFFILEGETGKILKKYPIPGSVSLSPTVSDIDQDGNQEVIVGTTGSNTLNLYRFGAKADAAAPWATKRHDSARTGYVPVSSSTETNAQQSLFWRSKESPPGVTLAMGFPKGVLWGSNQLIISSSKDLPARFAIEIAVFDPDGVCQRRIEPFEERPSILALPVSLNTPGNHEIRITLWDESVTPVKAWGQGTLSVNLEGINTLRGWSEEQTSQVLRQASDLLKQRPQSSRLLYEKAAIVAGNLSHLEALAKTVPSMSAPERVQFSKQVDQFREEVKQAGILAALAAQAPCPTFTVWEDVNPWDNQILLENSDNIPKTTPVKVWACQGETEHIALTVTSLHPDPIDIQFRPPLGGPFTMREVIPVPRKIGNMVPDALPETSQAHTLHFSPGETRQVWVEINTDKLTPGQHTFPLEILPIGVEKDRTHLEVLLEIAPINLRDAPEFAICNWANPLSIKQLTHDPQSVTTALEQGMTVWCCNGPGRSCDQEGNLIGQVDWTALDQQLALLDPEKAILLMSGPGVSIPSGVEPYGAIWKAGLQKAMRELATHLAEKGWSLSRWAYYPFDEPGLFAGVEEFARIARAAKEVCPEIQIYANPAGGVSRDNFGPLVNQVDVWAPELGLLRRQPELVDFFLETKDWVWSYEAPGEVKNLLPLGYYRAQCLTAFSMGFVGTGHWVFVSPGKDDPWTVFAHSTYGDMYYDGSKLVPSRRWLAFMDGAEDARFFLLLRKVAADVKQRGLNPPELAEVDQLFGDKLKHLIRKQWEQDDIARYLVDYEIDLQELKQLRRETAELTIRLQTRMAQ
jgi:hypothetical protein